MSGQLPDSYESLEPFVAQWAVTGTAARDRARGNSTAEQRQAFFEATKDQVARALEELDRKPLGELDTRERRLLDLLMSFAHVTMAVEMMGSAEPNHARSREVMRITRSPADA